MTWIELLGQVEGVKVRGNAYFREVDRLLSKAEADLAYAEWWAASKLPPVELIVELDHGREDSFAVTVRIIGGRLRLTAYREVAGMRAADKHQLNDALRGYAARDFRAMLEALRHRAGLGQPPPLDPALPAHAVLPPSADDGPPVVVLEVHIPLVAGKTSNEDPFAWTEDVEDFLAERVGPVTGLDDGEEIGDTYVFPLVGGGIGDLLFVAREIAALPGVPAGVYAVLTDSASVGSEDGRRIELDHPGSFGGGPV